MAYSSIPIWKEAPFIRLMIPLIAGILIEWHGDLPALAYKVIIPICYLLIILFSFLKSFTRFANYWLSGILINILLIGIAGLLTYYSDLRNNSQCITRMPDDNNIFIATLAAPLSEKANSFKTTASVNQAFHDDSLISVKGNIIIYFQKDSSVERLTYNSRIAFRNKLQVVKNSGNPGSFDYQRYCIFQQLFHQVYLKPSDYILLPVQDNHSVNSFLFKARMSVVKILQTYIPGRKEAGLAEALLIGYKDDLDKNLVQSYSNTGVVHIIAISGLHLGLIYWLLNLLLKPIKSSGKLRWVKAILVICGLWLFTLLTGGSASVCRSALMFSFIVMGENIGRNTNIYNSLAASAFLLLCYKPFWLWDAGFQLSYIAVLSIVIFMNPVYHLFYIKNKLLDYIWKMAAISIAAQILTTPLTIFHFKQFPNYFLITNVVAVPLSSIVVFAEIILCGISSVGFLAAPLGKIICWLIRIMDGFIEYINTMPYTLTDQLKLSLLQMALIYLFIFSAGTWIFQKKIPAFVYAMAFVCCFYTMKSYYKINVMFQKKLVVYHVPHQKAIDLIMGSRCFFIGDSLVSNNSTIQNFTLKPSRNEYRVESVEEFLQVGHSLKAFQVANKHILIIDSPIDLQSTQATYTADIVILSANPDNTFSRVQKLVHCKKIVLDSSIPNREVYNWKKDCEKAGIEFYSVAEKGAFILNLN